MNQTTNEGLPIVTDDTLDTIAHQFGKNQKYLQDQINFLREEQPAIIAYLDRVCDAYGQDSDIAATVVQSVLCMYLGLKHQAQSNKLNSQL